MCYWTTVLLLLDRLKWSFVNTQFGYRANIMRQGLHMIWSKGDSIATQNLYKYAKIQPISFQLSLFRRTFHSATANGSWTDISYTYIYFMGNWNKKNWSKDYKRGNIMDRLEDGLCLTCFMLLNLGIFKWKIWSKEPGRSFVCCWCNWINISFLTRLHNPGPRVWNKPNYLWSLFSLKLEKL